MFYSKLAPTDPWCSMLRTLLEKNMMRQCQVNTFKYRNLILFPNDKIFCKWSVVRDNSLHLILIQKQPLESLSQRLLLQKDLPIHTLHISISVHKEQIYMLNKFKIEFKELLFSYSLEKYFAVAFQGFLSKFT